MSQVTSQGIKITGEGRYPLVPLDQIEIVSRPEKGREAEQLFFNPRSLESFTPKEMEELSLSIRTDGLQQPPQVRAVTENGKVISVELIAGERRLKTLKKIVEEDYPCFDEDAKPPKKFRAGATVLHKGRFAKILSHKVSGVTIQLFDVAGKELLEEQRKVEAQELQSTLPGSKLYKSVPCRVIYNCNDERALRVAFGENDKHKNLKTKEEIALVERLLAMDLKQQEIADMLGTNVTWVSQTINFKAALPEDAFAKLLSGDMTRNVAVDIMAYKDEDREQLFQETIVAAQEDADKKSDAAQEEMEVAEDLEDLALADKRKAEEKEDQAAAKKAERTARAAANRAEKAKAKKERIEDDRGVIKQSHVATAATKTKLSPKKAKILSKAQIQDLCIESLEGLSDGGTIDPDYYEKIPANLVLTIQETAKFILNSGRDPLEIIREVQTRLGVWKAREDDDEFETDPALEAELESDFGDSDFEHSEYEIEAEEVVGAYVTNDDYEDVD